MKKTLKNNNIRRTKALQGILSILPVVLILLFIRIYPTLTAIYRSFTNWDGLYRSDWVGLTNYINIFTNSPFWLLLRNNMALLISVPLQIIIGLLVAVLLYEEVLGWRFFRVIVYIPQVISAVTIGFLFRIAFGLDGPLNLVLRKIGLNFLAIEWFGNSASALFVLVFVLTWCSIGWQAIVILGGMSKIPPSVFEAAKLDGANFWQRTFKIVVPMISRTIEYSVIMSMVWTFTSVFAFIYVITNGGPGYETSTIDYMIYLKFYQSSSNFGFASGLAVILLIIISILTILEMRFSNRVSVWE
ncbi:MAG: sugar ABC transporter permease [Actinobacteria bacterium]|nr:sugar ABC transporter permease [Actinomycetota bacterium]